MAKDNKNSSPAEAGVASTEDQQLVVKQKRKKLIIIIVAVVLLVGISVSVALMLLKPGGDKSSAEHEAEGGHEEKAKQPAIYYALSPAFIVNFQDKGRTRFLQADLTFLIRDPEVALALDMHMPLIRNNLVLLLGGQTVEDLQGAEGKEALRQKALVVVQDVLQKETGKPGVEQVLFINFVMQ